MPLFLIIHIHASDTYTYTLCIPGRTDNSIICIGFLTPFMAYTGRVRYLAGRKLSAHTYYVSFSINVFHAFDFDCCRCLRLKAVFHGRLFICYRAFYLLKSIAAAAANNKCHLMQRSHNDNRSYKTVSSFTKTSHLELAYRSTVNQTDVNYRSSRWVADLPKTHKSHEKQETGKTPERILFPSLLFFRFCLSG